MKTCCRCGSKHVTNYYGDVVASLCKTCHKAWVKHFNKYHPTGIASSQWEPFFLAWVADYNSLEKVVFT